MNQSPRAKFYFDARPVAGVDGTLAKRFRRSRAEGRIHAKTGTIEHVNTLSGYMELPSGRRLAFSLLADNNDLKSSQTIKTLDAIAQTIYDAYGDKRRRPHAARRRK